MATAVDPQTSIWEKEISNEALERALLKREELKELKKQAVKDYKAADDAVKALLENEELGIGMVVRCGDFIITKTHRDLAVLCLRLELDRRAALDQAL